MIEQVVQHAQYGLLTRAVYGQIVTITLRDRSPATRPPLLEAVRALARTARQFVRAYARGETGSNLITLTCADLSTDQAAAADPER